MPDPTASAVPRSEDELRQMEARRNCARAALNEAPLRAALTDADRNTLVQALADTPALIASHRALSARLSARTAGEVAELVAELRALTDDTMCFDGPATYALIGRAADLIGNIDAANNDLIAAVTRGQEERGKLRDLNDLQDRVFASLCVELGCERDNEEALRAIAALRQRVEELEREADEAERHRQEEEAMHEHTAKERDDAEARARAMEAQVERLTAALIKANRLLSVHEFDAPEDLADLADVEAALSAPSDQPRERPTMDTDAIQADAAAIRAAIMRKVDAAAEQPAAGTCTLCGIDLATATACGRSADQPWCHSFSHWMQRVQERAEQPPADTLARELARALDGLLGQAATHPIRVDLLNAADAAITKARAAGLLYDTDAQGGGHG